MSIGGRGPRGHSCGGLSRSARLSSRRLIIVSGARDVQKAAGLPARSARCRHDRQMRVTMQKLAEICRRAGLTITSVAEDLDEVHCVRRRRRQGRPWTRVVRRSGRRGRPLARSGSGRRGNRTSVDVLARCSPRTTNDSGEGGAWRLTDVEGDASGAAPSARSFHGPRPLGGASARRPPVTRTVAVRQAQPP
jgi:hypothetical protein